ncbi:MAG: hypothetical protein GY719_19180 [bacterium]|nr:hypothetical protein [bacterium]
MIGPRLSTLVELAVAVAAAAALLTVCPPGDPFRGTLGILPLVVAALRALERHASSRRLWCGEGRIAGLVLVALVVLTLQRHRLGLVATDWFLAAGFLLLLAHRTTRLLIALRPSLGKRLPRRPSWAFFLLPWIVYLAIQPWSSGHRQPDGDEPFYLLVAHSLSHDLDVDLANNYAEDDWRRFMRRPIEPQPGDPVGAGGEQYSRHSFLLPLALAPAYRLAGRAGAMAVMAALAAALAWMVLRLARHYTPERPGAALLAYGLFAFSPPLLLYSYQVWVEVPAALLVALALDRLLELRRGQEWTWRQVAALVVPIMLLPVLKLRLGLLAASLLALAFWRIRPRRAVMGWAAAGLAAVAAGLALYNLWRFDNPLRLYTWSELDLLAHSGTDYVRGAVGIFYDCAFGLFASAPVWLLLLPAVGVLLARRSPLLVDFLVVALPYLILVAPRPEWFGGWSPPFRYPLVFLPLLALALVPLLDLRSRQSLRQLIAILGALTLVLTVVWVVIPGWTYNFADGRTLLLDEASIRLGADVARFFPSTVRPRAATWWWLATSLLLVPLGWRLTTARRPPARGHPTAIWGVSAVLLALPLLIWAGRQLPTRVVHLEDNFVGREQGELYPPSWVLQRPRYTGGWALPAGGRLTVPVTPGGEMVTIRLYGRLDAEKGRGRLWIGAGKRRLGAWRAGVAWEEETLGPVAWPAGRPLVIRATDKLTAPVIIDRVELEWQ